MRNPAAYFSGLAPDVGAGALYRYRLDGGAAYPDPVSRFQPQGVHGPSAVVDASAFTWTDSACLLQRWLGASSAATDVG